MHEAMAEALTVFVITCGEESLKDCREALEAQHLGEDLDLLIAEIKDVTPMSEAFNEMHRRSKTPYFVQVDADMILHPTAIRTLWEGVKRSRFYHYAVYGQLYEEGFGVGGTVRCWKKSFFKFFQFRDVRTVDRNLFQRARRLGLKRKNLKTVLGVHRPRHSAFSEYLKTKSDVEKWRYLGREVERYAGPLFRDLVEEPQKNKYRLLGAMMGASAQWSRVKRSKDIFEERKSLEKWLSRMQKNDLDGVEIREDLIDPTYLTSLFTSAYSGSQNRHKLAQEASRYFH